MTRLYCEMNLVRSGEFYFYFVIMLVNNIKCISIYRIVETIQLHSKGHTLGNTMIEDFGPT